MTWRTRNWTIMTKRATCTALFLLAAISATRQAPAQTPAAEHVPGRLLAKTLDNVPDTALTQIFGATGVKVHHKINGIKVLVLDVPDQALDAMAVVLSRR